jgi:hypothetical protein
MEKILLPFLLLLTESLLLSCFNNINCLAGKRDTQGTGEAENDEKMSTWPDASYLSSPLLIVSSCLLPPSRKETRDVRISSS